jgi:3-oxoacyl-[acyl-carrier-protein] synthase II
MNSTWDGLVSSRSGLQRRESLGAETFLQNIAGFVDGIGPGTEAEDPAVSRLPARSLHLALHAARDAWNDARLDARPELDRDRVALAIGSAFGGLDLLDAETARAAQRKGLATSPYLVPGMIINQSAGQVAQHLKLYGPSIAPANACASGGHAAIIAALLLRAGEADFALCGASESAFTGPIVNGFATMKTLFNRKEDRAIDDPSQASRPFSCDRAGFVLSEGAAMLVLATESAAKRFGLPIQAELLGWSWNSDGYHMVMPDGSRVAKCLAKALAHAGVVPDEIDYYNAHGTSTVVNDKAETAALKEVFGPRAAALPVSSVKGALGHALGAASAIEAAVCVRALREQVIPPTINHRPDPDLDLDYVPNRSRPAALETVMSASFGFGGTNNALVFRRWTDA